jgi:zinc/manganese transport system permease protein
MFAHEFVRNAYLAGTFIALACGVVGWFVVLRAQVFAADALSHVAFVAAVAAAAAGIDEQLGLIVITLAVAGAMAALGRRGQADDVVIGISFAWILGVGILLVTVLATSSQGGQGTTAVNALFGSIYGLSAGAARVAAVVGAAVLLATVSALRPLLLSSLDPELAALRGVPVRALGIGFFAVLAVVTAESTQALGALLLLGLIAAPAGAAHQLTARVHLGIALSGLIAVGATWGGLALSYAVSGLPPSSAIIGLAAAAYAAAGIAGRLRRGRPKTGPAATPGGSHTR